MSIFFSNVLTINNEKIFLSWLILNKFKISENASACEALKYIRGEKKLFEIQEVKSELNCRSLRWVIQFHAPGRDRQLHCNP